MTLTKPVDLTIDQRPTAPRVGATMILTGVLSIASVVLAVLGVVAQATVGWWIGAVVVLAWAMSAVAVGRRVPRLGLALALVALATGAALAVGGAYESDPTDGLAQARSVMFALRARLGREPRAQPSRRSAPDTAAPRDERPVPHRFAGVRCRGRERGRPADLLLCRPGGDRDRAGRRLLRPPLPHGLGGRSGPSAVDGLGVSWSRPPVPEWWPS